MAGLFIRLRSAYREWRQEKRDIAAFRRFCAEGGEPPGGPQDYSLVAKSLMGFVLRFLASDESTISFELDGHCMKASAVFPSEVPVYLWGMWVRILDGVAGQSVMRNNTAEKCITICHPGGVRRLYFRTPSPEASERLNLPAHLECFAKLGPGVEYATLSKKPAHSQPSADSV